MNGAFMLVNGRDGKLLCSVDEWPDAGDIGHGDTKDYLHGGFSPLMAQSCVVADLDKDGRLEIMVHPNYHNSLLCFAFHQGLTRPRMIWRTRQKFKYHLYLYPLLAADVDTDGLAEVLVASNSTLHCLAADAGKGR